MRILFIVLGLCWFAVAKSQNLITPTVITTLPAELNETSGLLNLNGDIWTHTDNGGETEVYQINTANGNIIRTVEIHEVNNVDWEDIASDDDYIYIGDFGNNDGSRTNLKVCRISRSDLASSNDVDAEKINFTYSDQISFEPSYHYTNFDCEALISYDDKLYLFTKNWINNQTNVYELSNEPGDHVAEFLGSFNVNCLITGAEMIASLNTLLLTGYNESGGTYTWVFNNFSGTDFFGGINTKLIWTMLTQVEGICYMGNSQAYASSEKFAGELDPTLFSINLTAYMTQVETPLNPQVSIYTENNKIVIRTENGQSLQGIVQVLNMNGQVLAERNAGGDLITIHPPVSGGIIIVHYQAGNTLYCRKLMIR
jgi:hypothetical protein